jgi:periplasmic protein TonB
MDAMAHHPIAISWRSAQCGDRGTVLLWVQIDERGSVRQTEVVESSGYAQLDRVAEEVMREVARFRPALNRDQAVTVWVQIPVVFETR